MKGYAVMVLAWLLLAPLVVCMAAVITLAGTAVTGAVALAGAAQAYFERDNMGGEL